MESAKTLEADSSSSLFRLALMHDAPKERTFPMKGNKMKHPNVVSDSIQFQHHDKATGESRPAVCQKRRFFPAK